MLINKEIQYLRYVVRELSFKESKEDKKELENLTINLGYSSPIIESNDGKNIAIMPFTFTLKGDEAFSLTCKLQLGFGLQERPKDEEVFKEIVNKESEYFSKYIENAINKIISSTLINTAFNINEVFDIPKFSYND
ncbi:hypothetical protein BKG95_02485 [Rodentibacter pneumotropicus]|uniref:Uncharacterized protein n=1 Tax=Rodentibacter pneumotropicus TaxID=758 RepID=A0AAW5LBR0_9PAST|nr:hypothetical protein [Rodentibacter pneumotropicus]MCQ9120983.1 hypothetical protein [Rodentibacter pneumotropicus]OOF69152.1 hypothetical protein BKG95_02485 [Rodentibacter pneumotropicus]